MPSPRYLPLNFRQMLLELSLSDFLNSFPPLQASQQQRGDEPTPTPHQHPHGQHHLVLLLLLDALSAVQLRARVPPGAAAAEVSWPRKKPRDKCIPCEIIQQGEWIHTRRCVYSTVQSTVLPSG